MNMNRLKLDSEKGFTLIESMIAAVVMAISVLGLAQLIGVSVHQSALARNNTMAITVATQMVEELKTNFNKELNDKIADPFAADHTNLTAGAHGPRSVSLAPPTGSAMGTVTWIVSWDVVISGNQKTVEVEVAPQISNSVQNETVAITTVFMP